MPTEPAHLSIWILIAKADLIVKFVMLILLAASIISWTIIMERYFFLSKISNKLNSFTKLFWSMPNIDHVMQNIPKTADHPATLLFQTVINERDHLLNRSLPTQYICDRISSVIGVVFNRQSTSLEGMTPYLATIGSVAPFIGLFGTVWGIMNSFTAIANSNNTSLAVVAPGIAEALFATALGLVAAIPAVVAYNKINHMIGRYMSALEAFATELENIITEPIIERQE